MRVEVTPRMPAGPTVRHAGPSLRYKSPCKPFDVFKYCSFVFQRAAGFRKPSAEVMSLRDGPVPSSCGPRCACVVYDYPA